MQGSIAHAGKFMHPWQQLVQKSYRIIFEVSNTSVKSLKQSTWPHTHLKMSFESRKMVHGENNQNKPFVWQSVYVSPGRFLQPADVGISPVTFCGGMQWGPAKHTTRYQDGNIDQIPKGPLVKLHVSNNVALKIVSCTLPFRSHRSTHFVLANLLLSAC